MKIKIMPLLAVLMLAATMLRANEIEPPKAIKDWVLMKNKDFKEELPPAVVIGADSLTRKLGDWRFYAITYRSFPVAVAPPEPLAMRNLFILNQENKVVHVTTVDELKKFFIDRFPAVKEEGDCKSAVNAWLRLSTELHNDGMMHFAFPQEQIKVVKTEKGWEAVGAATLGGPVAGDPIAGGANAPLAGGLSRSRPAGDRGSVKVTIAFNPTGKATDINEQIKIQTGIRPRCQATKLLDADPIVREMARQDLLLMGTAARAYLLYQRAKATPELAAEIDKIWQEILDREQQWDEWSKGN